ncbi:MAG: UDP-N-acetylmuramate--L-alanine ligase [Pararhodobacter sp.]|nr:UDP-N-acetylmuramate--L-alanine ligase [Pararhodobacter sp.]
MTLPPNPSRKHSLLPAGLGPVHFIGIGGIGMSGIAEILLGDGHKVQGSDLKASAITSRLEGQGARIFIGQEAGNLGEAAVVVVSSAIRPDNPELAAARACGLPVVHRSEMLAEVMRLRATVAVAGTHGKTTTTTMVAALMDQAGLAPTVINGGVIHAYGSNARAGSGEWMVVEADESDGSFNRLPVSVAIVTNIDPEHMEHWGDIEALREGFRRFVQSIPFYGQAVLNTDHPEVAALADALRDRRITRFGLGEGADLRAEGVRFENGKALFDIRVKTGEKDRIIKSCELPMPGDHNVSNALAAVGVALHLGVDDATIRAGLAGFGGVARRFTRIGEVRGVTVIDDYGHHPVEIAAALSAARQSVAPGARVIAVHQPHRFTRLSRLFGDFCTAFAKADLVAIAPVYAAGEAPIAGASRDDLLAGIRASGHPSVHALDTEDDLEALVRAHARPGDMVICLGAGTISAWAQALPARLDAA